MRCVVSGRREGATAEKANAVPELPPLARRSHALTEPPWPTGLLTVFAGQFRPMLPGLRGVHPLGRGRSADQISTLRSEHAPASLGDVGHHTGSWPPAPRSSGRHLLGLQRQAFRLSLVLQERFSLSCNRIPAGQKLSRR